MPFENYNPSGYKVVAELTENSPGGAKDKGHHYTVLVPVMHPDFDKLDDKAFRDKYGYLDICRNLDEARNRIQADKDVCRALTDASGLVSWPKSAAREYAIFKITAERVE
jgi:hypothetical protein